MSEPHRAPLAASLFVIAGVALVPLYPYVFYVRPGIADEQRNAAEELHTLDVRVEQARAAQRKYAQFREEMVRLDDELAKQRTLLPEEDRVGRQAEEAAQKHELTLIGIEPLAPVHRDTYDERAYDVSLQGSLEAIHAFADDFDEATAIAALRRIHLKRDGESWRATTRIQSFTMH